MKICFDCDYTAPAKDSMGAERVIEALTIAFQNLGHTVIMRLNPDSKNTPAPLVKEIPIDCDIINFSGWIPGKSEIEYPKYNIPFCVTLYGGGIDTDPNWLRTICNPHIICVSKFIADRIGTKAYVWTCSNPSDFIYEIKKDDYFLWMAGTDWQVYNDGKGLWQTILLAKKLGFKLKIAGTGRNKKVIDIIKSFCDNKINYIGSINGKEKAEILSKAKALILLTQLPDACPTVVGEAFLSGTPVIGSIHGSMPELINKKVGFVCKNTTDVAKAISKIESINPYNCYQYGLANFSAEVCAKKYIQLYQNMIEYGRLT